MQELVSIEPWTMLAMACNLVIQMWILRRLLFRPVQRVLQARETAVREEREAAEQARRQAEADRADYEARLRRAGSETEQLRKNAARAAQEERTALLEAAKREAAALLEQGEAALALERRQTVQELGPELAAMAMELAERLLAREIDAQKHRELIADFIDSLGDAS